MHKKKKSTYIKSKPAYLNSHLVPQVTGVQNIIRRQPHQQVSASAKKDVLVTGFNDWEKLGNPRNINKCDKNPSCRLLTGTAMTSQPTNYAGSLTSQLRKNRNISWHFKTLPVVWGSAAANINYQNYDAVINMGLGVYDTRNEIQLEHNAINQRSGKDAAGRKTSRKINSNLSDVSIISASRNSLVEQNIKNQQGQSLSNRYSVRIAQARRENNYICNETHYHALSELARSQARTPPGKLKLVHFIHLPHARRGSGYSGLAGGTADLIARLLRPL